MSASELLDRIEETGMVDAKTLAKLRREIDRSSKSVKASAIAKFLIEKGHMTKSQVDRLMATVEAAEQAATSADVLSAKGVHRTDDLLDIIPAEVKPKKPSGYEGIAEVVPVEVIDDGTRVYGIDEVMEHDGAVEVDVEVEKTSALGGGAFDPLYGDPGQDPLGGDAYGTTYVAPEPEAQVAGFAGKVDTSDQWQTKWLFIGFGILAILAILGAVLILALSGESAENLLQAAETSFAQHAYLDAAKKYQEFSEKFPSHEKANYTKVRAVRALLAGPYERRNYSEVFSVAKEQLPGIADLIEMEDLRSDLGLFLPDVALHETEATLKKTSQDEMSAGLEKIRAIKVLVDDVGYIPGTIRKLPAVAEKIEKLENDIKLIERSINKEQDYAQTMVKIKDLTAQNETDLAFSEYYRLTRSYGEMAARPELREAMKAVSAAEMLLVKPAELSIAVESTEAATPVVDDVLVFSTVGETISSLRDDVIPILAEGAVYGVNAGDGSLMWRRFVGYETRVPPKWLDPTEKKNLIVSDQKNHEVACVEGKSGELVWRAVIGQPFHAPTMDAQTLYVTTISGAIIRLDPFTGKVVAAAQLPKKMSTPVEKAEGVPYVYAVAEDSNLYVLSAEDLTCKEVFYIGHFPGSLAVPPSYWSGFMLVPVNGSGYCDLHVLSFAEKGLKTDRVQVIRIADGSVTIPPSRLGRWMLFLSDNGEVKILELNTTEDEVPVRKIAEQKFENRGQDRMYMLAESNDLWIASKGIVRYRIQRTLGEFERQSIVNSSDFFIGSISKIDTHVFHLRRRIGSQQVSISAVDALTLAEAWRTDFGASCPTSPLPVGNAIAVATSQGDVYFVDQATMESGTARNPVRSSDIDQALTFADRVDLGNDRMALVGPAGSGDILFVDLAGKDTQLSRMQAPADQPACTPIGLGADVLVPTTKGQVVRVDPQTGRIIGNAFQPSLRPGQETQWNRPILLQDGTVVIGDRERSVYALDPSDRQSIREGGKLVVDGDLVSDFATDGQSVFLVLNVSDTHRLVRIDNAGEMSVAATVDLPAQLVDGPRVADGKVFVVLENGKLHCYDTQCQATWTVDIENQKMAGILARPDSGWDVAVVSGKILRLGGDGSVQQVFNVGQPIRNSPVMIGQQLYINAADGTLLALDPNKL